LNKLILVYEKIDFIFSFYFPLLTMLMEKFSPNSPLKNVLKKFMIKGFYLLSLYRHTLHCVDSL